MRTSSFTFSADCNVRSLTFCHGSRIQGETYLWSFGCSTFTVFISHSGPSSQKEVCVCVWVGGCGCACACVCESVSVNVYVCGCGLVGVHSR